MCEPKRGRVCVRTQEGKGVRDANPKRERVKPVRTSCVEQGVCANPIPGTGCARAIPNAREAGCVCEPQEGTGFVCEPQE